MNPEGRGIEEDSLCRGPGDTPGVGLHNSSYATSEVEPASHVGGHLLPSSQPNPPRLNDDDATREVALVERGNGGRHDADLLVNGIFSLIREVPDEVDRNAVIRPPRSEEGRPQIRGGRHSCSTLVSQADACSSWMVRMSMWRFDPDHSKRLNNCGGMAPDD